MLRKPNSVARQDKGMWQCQNRLQLQTVNRRTNTLGHWLKRNVITVFADFMLSGSDL